MTLPPDTAARVAAIIPRLASDFEGEVIATARAIGRVLQSAGCDFNDLAAVVSTEPADACAAVVADEGTIVRECLDHEGLFSQKEIGFLASVGRLIDAGHGLSDKQRAWLLDLHRIAITGWRRGRAA